MITRRRIFRAATAGVIIWFISDAGFYFCLLAGGPFGRYLYEPFSLLAFWPLAIVSLVFPEYVTNRLEWPMPCIISLIGWLVFTMLVAILFQAVSGRRGLKPHDENKVL